MKYLSIDIETSGLDFEKCSITTIGIIIEDTEKQLSFSEIPKLHLALIHDGIYFEPIAAEMNSTYIMMLANIKKYGRGDNINGDLIWCTENQVVDKITNFLQENNFELSHKHLFNGYMQTYHSINVAGKNFNAFDRIFLEQLYGWKSNIEVNRRVLDPAQFYVDFKNDKELPSLSLCKKRAGLDSNVSHNAIEDAWDVIELLRKKYV